MKSRQFRRYDRDREFWAAVAASIRFKILKCDLRIRGGALSAARSWSTELRDNRCVICPRPDRAAGSRRVNRDSRNNSNYTDNDDSELGKTTVLWT